LGLPEFRRTQWFKYLAWVLVVLVVVAVIVLFTVRTLVGLLLGRTNIGAVARSSDQTQTYSVLAPIFFVAIKKYY
jgi:hypothetical protein